MYFLYDCIQLIGALFMLPKLGSRYLGLSLPKVKPKKGKVFLLYAVSMGETRAASSLFHKMKEQYPEDQFYILSRTATGHAEAKKSMQSADGHFFLPVDFSFVMKRFLKHLSPDALIIMESDFWLNFLRCSKKLGALVFLVSGKMSETSFKRFQTFSFFSKKLFSSFDFIGTQNAVFKERFIKLGVDPSKVSVTGNLKFDLPFSKIDTEDLKQRLGIQKLDKVVVVGSTHAGEEEAILNALAPIISHFRLIIVPRHPERFLEVENLLSESRLSTIAYSKIDQKKGSEQVILIDTMGLLLSLYQIADLAIVGGSFLKHLKGHNIFEPIQAGAPVLFGPYMSDQKDLVECTLFSHSGAQVSLKDLRSKVEELLLGDSTEMRSQGKELVLQMRGASSRTSEALSEKISSSKKESFVV